jgi:cysteine desulfurase/selenocysteine lyase
MIDWNEVRSYFPVTKKFVYLNPAGGSPMPIQAANEGKRFYDEMLAGGDSFWDEWLERMEQTRAKVADLINAEPAEVGFAQNTSHAMSIVASMLKNEGEVITMHDEFPSSTYPWLQNGVKLHFVKPVNGIYRQEEIEQLITPMTRILVSSYVQYNTGFRQDMEALGHFCKKNNLIFVINATQGMGSMPIDVRKFQADFLVFTGLKWTFAGYGVGGVYINKKWFDKLNFPAAGWRSAKEPELMNNQVLDIKKNASEVELGCMNFPNIFALGGGLDLLKSIGQNIVFERIMELNNYIEKRFDEEKIPIASIRDIKYRSGITIIKNDNATEIVKKLYLKKIFVSARGEGIRISVHIFNNYEDIEKLIAELKAIL